MVDIGKGFEDLEGFIPGSRKKLSDDRAQRSSQQKPKKEQATGWDRRPLRKRDPDSNKEMDFFTIGALAEALGKSPVTIRSWIQKKWLPRPRYRLPPTQGTISTAGRRLWSRAEIEGILKIAEEEKVVRTRDEHGFNINYIPDIEGSNFVTRVFEFWKESHED